MVVKEFSIKEFSIKVKEFISETQMGVHETLREKKRMFDIISVRSDTVQTKISAVNDWHNQKVKCIHSNTNYKAEKEEEKNTLEKTKGQHNER